MKEAHKRDRGLIFGSTKVKATIKRMYEILKRKPKEAFDRMRKYVHAVNNNEILGVIRAQKLLKALSRVPVRVLRDATQRIFWNVNKVKGAIKKIYSAMQKMPKVALEKWRKYVIACKNKDCFDNLRSAKLLNCLSKIPFEELEKPRKESSSVEV